MHLSAKLAELYINTPLMLFVLDQQNLQRIDCLLHDYVVIVTIKQAC